MAFTLLICSVESRIGKLPCLISGSPEGVIKFCSIVLSVWNRKNKRKECIQTWIISSSWEKLRQQPQCVIALNSSASFIRRQIIAYQLLFAREWTKLTSSILALKLLDCGSTLKSEYSPKPLKAWNQAPQNPKKTCTPMKLCARVKLPMKQNKMSVLHQPPAWSRKSTVP